MNGETDSTAGGRSETPKATHAGTVKIGGYQLEAAVLTDGRRILARQSVLEAMGRRGQPKTGSTNEKGQNFNIPPFLEATNLKPFIGEDLSTTSIPIRYISEKGGRAIGYEARVLPMACEVYLSARRAGVLLPSQLHIANACEILIRGFAQVGIVGLVDEATGYQEIRDKKALQAILDRYLKQEHAAWAKRFPDDFYKHMFRLKGWVWNEMKPSGGPRCIATYTNDLVYERIESGLLRELESRNPIANKGRRKAAHHQFLTDDVGHPALEKHIHAVVSLMKAAADESWESFLRMMDRALPKKGNFIQLDFSDLG